MYSVKSAEEEQGEGQVRWGGANLTMGGAGEIGEGLIRQWEGQVR